MDSSLGIILLSFILTDFGNQSRIDKPMAPAQGTQEIEWRLGRLKQKTGIIHRVIDISRETTLMDIPYRPAIQLRSDALMHRSAGPQTWGRSGWLLRSLTSYHLRRTYVYAISVEYHTKQARILTKNLVTSSVFVVG